MRLTFTALLALLFCSLCVKCYIPGLPGSRGERSDKAERSTTHPLSEMLVPRGSTTALMCEPVFSGNAQSAYWLQNGRVVANVTRYCIVWLCIERYHSWIRMRII
ncbi:hypothetical protein AB6A40_004524 [Gnathostoma spinigerum]|uniref:Uncharacterized protein n=1 Tax=Gnathostoma spinigerum TaxID=75299 RepID=A0ABD6EDV4_9BILA